MWLMPSRARYGEAGRVAEAEPAVELQAVGGARDRRVAISLPASSRRTTAAARRRSSRPSRSSALPGGRGVRNAARRSGWRVSRQTRAVGQAASRASSAQSPSLAAAVALRRQAGQQLSRRSRSSCRWRASAAACAARRQRCQSRIVAACVLRRVRVGQTVAGSLAATRAWRTRRARPSVTAAASSPSKSQKNRNGVAAPNSSPMNSSGGDGASSSDRPRPSQRARSAQRGEPLAERAVADLVVVLQEVDERGRRQVRARLAARRAVAVGRGSPWYAKPSARQRRAAARRASA